MKTIAVETITIKVGNKELNLTLEEFKELRDVLNSTFPETIKYVPSIPINVPCYPSIYPQITYTDRTPNFLGSYDKSQILC